MRNINDKGKISSFLQTNELHHALSPSLISTLRLVKVEAGEYLITQDSKLTHLFCLVDGKLQVEHYELDGSRAVFSFEEAFSVVGDLELFMEECASTVSTVKAVSEAYLLTLPISVIKEKGMKDPNFLIFICRQLSKKLFESSLLHSNASFPVAFKLRRYLLFKKKHEGEVIQLEKRESLAAMLGVSVRQLNRSLSQLADLGVIEFKNKTVRVLDGEMLSNISPTDF